MTSRKPTENAPAKRRGTRESTILGVEPTLRADLLLLVASEQQADSLVEIVDVIRFDLRARRRRQHGGQTMKAQWEALQAMSQALDDAIGTVGVAANLIDDAGLGMVLRKRLDHSIGADAGGRVRGLLDAAHALRPVVWMALQKMPKAQARDRVSTTPIRLIHERTGLAPSTAETSAFRSITVRMYRAAGFPHENPDAAIRAYNKLRPET